MAIISREIKEGLQYQGADEKVAYTLNTSPWGGSPGSASAKIFTVIGGEFEDETSTYMSGSTSVADDIITLPIIQNLVDGMMYRVEVLFTISGNVFEAYARLQGER